MNIVASFALSYVKARLKEPSTWRGIILGITAAGIHLSPALQNEILIIGLTLCGGIGALLPDSLLKGGIDANGNGGVGQVPPDKLEPAGGAGSGPTVSTGGNAS